MRGLNLGPPPNEPASQLALLPLDAHPTPVTLVAPEESRHEVDKVVLPLTSLLVAVSAGDQLGWQEMLPLLLALTSSHALPPSQIWDSRRTST